MVPEHFQKRKRGSMINNFDQCLEWLLEHEGGYVNHPDDPGGRTNKGITANTYEAWLGRGVSEEMIRNIPDDHVEKIYREKFWDRIKADHLPPGIDWSVFDWCVNSGPSRAARALQLTVGADSDGFIGPATLDAVDKSDVIEVIEEMHQKRQRFYESLKTFETFGRGWTRRNDATKEQALELARLT